MPLVCFDLEATGVDVSSCEIVSITAEFHGEYFDSLVKPRTPIPPESTEVHGITDEMVACAPRWRVVGPAFLDWVFRHAGPVVTLCAYNGAGFDMPLLMMQNATLHPKSFPAFTRVYLCDPFLIAKRVMKKSELREGRNRQAHVYEALFGRQPDGQHTSLGDVEALKRIVEHKRFRGRLSRTRDACRRWTGRSSDGRKLRLS